MLEFDLEQSPPTRQEILAEQQRLKEQRKQLLKSGLISDGLHALILFSLYFADLLSGTAFIIAVLVGTVIAITLATGTRSRLVGSDRLALSLVVVSAALAVVGLTVSYFKEPVADGIVAGLATASIILTGSLLGRKIMQVLASLEALETIDAEHPAHQQLMELCRTYPELEDYRQQARDILRPFLTFGELKSMQEWVKKGKRC